MTALPNGWVSTTLGEISDHPQYGWTTRASDVGSVRFLRTTDITRGPINWNTVPFCAGVPPDIDKYRIAEGDILVSRAGSVGASASILSAPEAVFASYLIRFRVDSALDRRFVAYFLQSPVYWEFIAASSSGIALQNVNARKLANLPIPLPPLAEQHRIVDAIEAAFSKLDAGLAYLEAANKRLERLRGTILAAAVSGRLVPQYPNEKSARLGLANIGIRPLPEADLGVLPVNWDWYPLGSLAHTALGKMLDAKQQTGRFPTPYLRNINVRWGRFDLNDVATMDIRPEEMDRVLARSGHILACEGGEPGRCAVWRSESPIAVQKALHLIRPNEFLDPDYLVLVLQEASRSGRLSEFFTGTTIKHLPQEKLRLVNVPLPPIDEQRRIVIAAERQLSLVIGLEIGQCCSVAPFQDFDSLPSVIVGTDIDGAPKAVWVIIAFVFFVVASVFAYLLKFEKLHKGRPNRVQYYSHSWKAAGVGSALALARILSG